jgi:hypothetical protein
VVANDPDRRRTSWPAASVIVTGTFRDMPPVEDLAVEVLPPESLPAYRLVRSFVCPVYSRSLIVYPCGVPIPPQTGYAGACQGRAKVAASQFLQVSSQQLYAAPNATLLCDGPTVGSVFPSAVEGRHAGKLQRVEVDTHAEREKQRVEVDRPVEGEQRVTADMRVEVEQRAKADTCIQGERRVEADMHAGREQRIEAEERAV